MIFKIFMPFLSLLNRLALHFIKHIWITFTLNPPLLAINPSSVSVVLIFRTVTTFPFYQPCVPDMTD